MRTVRWALLAFMITVLIAAPVAVTQESPVAIRYHGHSFFLLTAGGLRIAIDPYGEIGYPLPAVEGDVVLITHEHRDHNNADLVRGAKRVLRGLAPGAWAATR